MFWKRFSVAVNATQELDEEKSVSSAASMSHGGSVEKSKSVHTCCIAGNAGRCGRPARNSNADLMCPRDDWLHRQHQKKRRCRIIGWSAALTVALAITAIAVVAWYFTAGPGKAEDAAERDS